MDLKSFLNKCLGDFFVTVIYSYKWLRKTLKTLNNIFIVKSVTISHVEKAIIINIYQPSFKVLLSHPYFSLLHDVAKVMETYDGMFKH